MGKYYILLCDGMGTGPEAVREGRTAAELLRQMLQAGYPGAHALRSLNSLCALRERAGAVTADLAEIDLQTGKGVLYKWGAAPSYLVHKAAAERIGSTGPPPGLSVAEEEEKRDLFALTGGRLLVMTSDGVDPDQALRCCMNMWDRSPEDLARGLIACGVQEGEDDVTVCTIALTREEK